MTPPFAPGQKVWTDWLITGRWKQHVVAKVTRPPHFTQTGWWVEVVGGLRTSVRDSRRFNGIDSAWFREDRPDAGRS
jgi:hypothetical protein